MIQKEQLKTDRVRVKDIDEVREGRNNEGKKKVKKFIRITRINTNVLASRARYHLLGSS